VAASTTCRIIIEDILHSAAADPETLHYFNARDEAALRVLSTDLLPSLQQRQQTLAKYLLQAASPGADGVVPEGALRVSEKVKKLWVDRLDAIGLVGVVLSDAEKPEAALDEAAKAKRDSFFKSAKLAWEGNLVQVLVQLDKEIEGPFVLGDQFSIADLHLAGWFTHVVKLAGGSASDDGSTIVKKLEAHIGGGFAFPQTFLSEQARRENSTTGGQAKLGAFWDAARQRPSWKKVYVDGIF
jgi:glutathione S-transferase